MEVSIAFQREVIVLNERRISLGRRTPCAAEVPMVQKLCDRYCNDL